MVNVTLKKGLWSFVQTQDRALRNAVASASFRILPPPPQRNAPVGSNHDAFTVDGYVNCSFMVGLLKCAIYVHAFLN